MQDLSILAIGAIAGFLIGATSFGGMLIVPALAMFAGLPVQQGIPAAMLSFLPGGVAVTWLLSRRSAIDWSLARWLIAGAMPGAFAGAFSVRLFDPSALEVVIGLLSLAAGVHALRGADRWESRGDGQARDKAGATHASVLFAAGVLVGWGSALTGTGGPVLLAPLLLFIGVPVVSVVGLGQAIQIPISALATGGNVGGGLLEWGVALPLACGVLLGALVGAWVSTRIRTAVLAKVVAATVIAIGLLFLARGALRVF